MNFDGRWGYIRTDLVRLMTIAEEEAYLQSQLATPTPATTNLPFDQNGLSSYGYVDASSVNWREGPATSARKIGELRRYAFCLVLGTEYANGVTWYRVSYGDKTGYIHGDFFKQMTISELEDFLGSDEYLQGVANNSANGDAGMDDVGYVGPGGLVSAEDQVIHDNQEEWVTPQPWPGMPTTPPVPTATNTLEPLPGHTATAQPVVTGTPEPTATAIFNPMPEVTYPTVGGGEGGSMVIWVLVIGLLLLAVGGVFVLVRHQQNKRRIAMKVAQRRAQAARSQQRPHARNAAPDQPRTGMYPNQQTRRADVGGGDQFDQSFDSPYAPYSGAGTYFRPMEDAFTPEDPENFVPNSEGNASQPTGRVGRRTAYRQAQRVKDDQSFDM